MEKKFGALSSSVNPEQLANTVRGLILSLSGVLVYFVSNILGFNLVEGDVVDIATVFGALAGSVWAVYGLIQKLVVKLVRR